MDARHNAYRAGAAAGGVSTSGGFGFGGRGAPPGTGRTSIGGGSGATCWLITGAFGSGGAAAAGGRGAMSFGF